MSDETNSPTTFALRELLDKVSNSMAPEAAAKNLALLIRCPWELQVTTDRLKLDRVITNLVSNAVKFTDVGSVSVDVEHSSSGVEIHVRDTGCGRSTVISGGRSSMPTSETTISRPRLGSGCSPPRRNWVSTLGSGVLASARP